MKVYDDCITNSITTTNPLPHWYLLMDNDKIIGCAGLITNDFISRMDFLTYTSAQTILDIMNTMDLNILGQATIRGEKVLVYMRQLFKK